MAPSFSLGLGLSLLACLSAGLACERARASESSTPTDEGSRAAANAETLDDLVAALEDPKQVVSALAALRKLAYETGANGSADERAQFAARMLPALESRWAVGAPEERSASLSIAMTLADPAGAGLWRLALSGEDPEQTRLALEGIQQAEAWTLADSVLERYERELVSLDPDNERHADLVGALIEVLGRARSTHAVEPLIALLERPELERGVVPREVAKAAVSALGLIADARAVETLITVQFRVADAPGTQSIGERCVRALGAIGEAALPGVLMAFAGNNRRLSQLIDRHELPPSIAQQAMARILAVIGSARAVDPLLATFPMEGCAGSGPADPQTVMMRAFFANSLGWIADARSVDTLCACAGSQDPTESYEIVSALGHIGGAEAFACLLPVVDAGSYDPDSVGPGRALELRSESFRFAVLAAGPAQLPELDALLARALPQVRTRIDESGATSALEVLRSCGEDPECNTQVLADTQLDASARERAAFSLVRAAAPGDLQLAAALSRAFAVQDPDVRRKMAWLAAKVADGRACPACIEALESTMDAERLTKAPSMQGAWITARQSIDKFYAGRSE